MGDIMRLFEDNFLGLLDFFMCRTLIANPAYACKMLAQFVALYVLNSQKRLFIIFTFVIMISLHFVFCDCSIYHLGILKYLAIDHKEQLSM